MRRRRCPTLVRYLAEDRPLAIATFILSLVALWPMTRTRVLPLVDLANHVALVSQVERLLAGDPLVSEHFMLQPHPSPYWLSYVLLWVFGSLLGPYLGAKVVVGISILATPLGLMRLAIALGRSPRFALWAFALCWDLNQQMGFLAYTLTTGLSFFFVARAVDAVRLRRLSAGWLAGTAALGFVLANSHAHAAGTASALVGAVALAELPHFKRFWRLGWLSTIPTLSLLPWLLFAISARTGTERDPAGEHVAFLPHAGIRVTGLFDHSLNLAEGFWPNSVEGLVFLGLLILPLLYARGQGLSMGTRRALSLYLATWVLYMVMPQTILRPFYQFFIHGRYATLILLMGLLLPRGPTRGRAAWKLAPGVALAVAMSLVVAGQFRTFDRRVEPFWRIVDAVGPSPRVNWVLWENSTPESTLRTLTTLPAYITAEKGGYTPHLFQTPNLPVVYDDSAHLPFVPWYEPYEFDPELHLEDYDYVVVQGTAPGSRPKPATREERRQLDLRGEDDDEAVLPAKSERFRTRLVVESGRWRLYAVEPRTER